MSNKTLRVLTIEDSEDDALLLVRFLKKGGYNPVYERVETAAVFKKALKEKQWDIILCDYSLPNFNAPSAITLLKESNIDIPIIVVTGTVGEETAAECMRLGAQDYILKANLSRLCPAIARELEDAKIRNKGKHTKEKLRYEEERFRAFAENSSDIIVVVNREGIITYENPAVEKILGFKLEERIGAGRSENLHPDDMKHVTDSFNTLFGNKNAPAQQSEVRLRHRDGSWRIFEAIASHLVHDNVVEAIIVNLRDITERKLAEEALREREQSLASIYNTVGDVIFHLAVEPAGQFRFASVNSAFSKVTGLSTEMVVGRTVNEIIPEPSLTMVLGKYQQAIVENMIVRWEEVSDYPTGRLTGIVSIAPVFDDKGNCTHLVGSVQDITERKRSEDELRRVNRALRILSETNEALIHVADEATLLNEVCRITVEVGGYRMAWIGLAQKDEAKTVRPVAHAGFESGYIESVNVTWADNERGCGPSGTAIRTGQPCIARNILLDPVFAPWREEAIQRGYKSSIALPLITEGQTLGVLGIYSVNTDAFDVKEVEILKEMANDLAFGINALRTRVKRDQAEVALSESEERYRLISENTADLISIMDMNMHFTYVSPASMRLLGLTVEEAMERTLEQVLTPESLRLGLSVFEEEMELENSGTADPDRMRILELEEYKKDGSTIWMEVSLTFLRDKDKKPVEILMVSRDITERRQAEEVIQQSEKRFKTLYQESPISTFTWQKKGNDFFLVDFNHATAMLTEGKARIFMGTSAHELYRGRPEIFNDMLQCFEKQSTISKELVSQDFAPGKSLSVYYSYIAPDLVITHAQDITEVKQAVEALQRSEENFRLSLDNSPLGVRISSIEAETLYANKAILDIYGYDSIEELNNTPLKGRYTPQSYAEYQIRMEKRKRGELGPSEYEISIVRKNGEIRNIQVFRKEVIWNGAKQFQVIYKDITEYKRAEEKLKETLESLRKSIKTTIQVLGTASETRDPYTAGHQKRVADLARAIATEMGLDQDKIEGIRMAGSIHDIGKLSIPAEILVKPTKLTNIEFSLIKEHPRIGYEMLKDVESPWPLAEIVYQHHERMNGSGYPRNLKGDEILIEARIIAVADVMEAMASHRPYRPTLGIEAALEEIEENKGILYDDVVANACLKLFREKGYQLT